MKVKDVMTVNLLNYCTLRTKIHMAAKTMSTMNFGALPVVDKEKRVLGMITDRDICLSLVKNYSTPMAKTTVNQIMPKTVFTVNINDDVSTAFNHMKENQIAHLPVVDAGGKLKGIVSLQNLINKSIGIDGSGQGNVFAPGESLMRTIYAINTLYNSNDIVNIKKNPSIKQNENYSKALFGK